MSCLYTSACAQAVSGNTGANLIKGQLISAQTYTCYFSGKMYSRFKKRKTNRDSFEIKVKTMSDLLMPK